MTTIAIRIPEIEETPLSSEEIIIAIRDGVEPALGCQCRVPVLTPRSDWDPVIGEQE